MSTGRRAFDRNLELPISIAVVASLGTYICLGSSEGRRETKFTSINLCIIHNCICCTHKCHTVHSFCSNYTMSIGRSERAAA